MVLFLEIRNKMARIKNNKYKYSIEVDGRMLYFKTQKAAEKFSNKIKDIIKINKGINLL